MYRVIYKYARSGKQCLYENRYYDCSGTVSFYPSLVNLLPNEEFSMRQI